MVGVIVLGPPEHAATGEFIDRETWGFGAFRGERGVGTPWGDYVFSSDEELLDSTRAAIIAAAEEDGMEVVCCADIEALYRALKTTWPAYEPLDPAPWLA